jgi:NDP-sugar pyrophosphorylase family protein
VKTVIFCGGMGARIRDASDLPKPLLPIGGLPIVWPIMRGYAHHGFNDVVLCLGYTLREYNLLNGLWQGGDAPWKVWGGE